MSSGKGGGGSDAAPMLEYGNRALDLQEKIYKEQRADAQPWYQTGVGAVNQLSNLMGIKSTPTASSRQALIDQYTPQFTSQVQGGQDPQNQAEYNRIYAMSKADPTNQDLRATLANFQLQPTTTSSVDSQGLNSYVDNLLSQQGGENPSDFGKLAKNFSMEDYQADPGYQFRLNEGNKALERKLNASGKTYSPEAAKALMGYNQEMGSQEYGNAYNRFNIDQDSLFNRLAALSGYGQTASGQLAQAGSNYGQGATDLLTGMGNAVTSSNLANKANNGSMFKSLLGAGAQIGASYLMSDERLKENIILLGEENGFPIYQFNYINIPEKTYIGVMAQDIQKIKPEAVSEVEGYMAVNYDMLGLRMREVMGDTCH